MSETRVFGIRQLINNVRRVLADPGPKGSSTVSQAPPAIMSEAPVTISIAQLDELRAQIRQGHARVAQLEAELVAAKQRDPTGSVTHLETLARNLLVIARFAIANLPPSEIPKWPFAAVEAVAGHLKHLPGFNEDDQVLITELGFLVSEIKEHELDRARRYNALIASAPSYNPPRLKLEPK
jgi:hypothetical protein